MFFADMVLKVWRVYAFSADTLSLLASVYCKQLPLYTSVGYSRLAVAFQDPSTATFCVVLYHLLTNGTVIFSVLPDWIVVNFSTSLFCYVLFL